MSEQVFHSIPDLDNLSEPATRSERLEAIVGNLDAQRNVVRSRILTAALDELKTLQAAADIQHAANTANASPIESPSSADTTPNPGLIQLLASMGSSTRSPGTHLSPHNPQSPSTAAKNLAQAPIPPEVQIAQRTMRELEEYDANFSKLRAKYAGALERERQLGGDAGDTPPQHRQSVAAASGAERRRSSFAAEALRVPRSMNAAAPIVAHTGNAVEVDGEVDRERDPRRRRSSVSAATAALSMVDGSDSAGRAHEIDAQRDPRRR